MYETVARIRVKAENREKLREVLHPQSYQTVPGFLTSYIVWQDDADTAWLFPHLRGSRRQREDADDPASHERYLEYRAPLEDEPEWHDGEIEQA